MYSPPLSVVSADGDDVESLARMMMTDLLSKREFRRLWSSKVEEITNVMEKSWRPAECRESKERLVQASRPSTRQSTRRQLEEMELHAAFVAYGLEQLTQAIELATKSFSRGRSMAFHALDRVWKFGLDSTSLYSIKIQLERFCAGDELRVAQFGLIARRFTLLLRQLAVRLTQPYSVESCALFSSNLCDALCSFDEYISAHCVVGTTRAFQRAVDEFYIDVVKDLDAMVATYQQKRVANYSRPSSSGYGTSLKSYRSLSHIPVLSDAIVSRPGSVGPTLFISTVAQQLAENKPARRKSFLLSPDIQEAKRLLAKRRTMERGIIESTRRRSALPKTMLESSQVNRKRETRKPNTSHGEKEAALIREACQLTKEIVEDLAQRLGRLRHASSQDERFSELS